jgi:hypothetical protein
MGEAEALHEGGVGVDEVRYCLSVAEHASGELVSCHAQAV